MRNPNKSLLGETLLKDSTIHKETKDSTNYVLDGGVLLHRLYWNLPVTFWDIIDQYCSFVTRRYDENTCIGYKASTKDHEHQRRGQMFAGIVLQPQTEVSCKQTGFLSNNNNKALLIKSLSTALHGRGHSVVVCDEDADKMIVMKHIEIAQQGHHSTVAADNTDILVIFLHIWSPSTTDVMLHDEARKGIKKDLEQISI